MAANSVRINHAEVAKLLKSDEVMAAMRKIANRIVERTEKPDDYVIEEWVGVNRARVSVWTNTTAARVNEARDHVLLNALGSQEMGDSDG